MGEVRLILDEPTASLSSAETVRLFAVLEGLAARGLAILYISHRMGDLKRLTHRIAVLRGGRMVAEFRRPIEGDVAKLVATSDPEEALEVADRLFVLDSRGLRPFGDGVLTGDPIDPPLSDGLHDRHPD